MKIFLLVFFSFYFTVEFMSSFIKWLNTKTNKEYWWGFVDTAVQAAVLFAFIKLINILSEVA